ncbi:MAG: hypothetical protein NC116_01945 [Clostridium sp.]|nr:hypothetical protein [Clostridium sp.]
MALDISKDTAKTIDDAAVVQCHENMPITGNDAYPVRAERETKHSRFRFSMCDMKIGEQLTFVPSGLTIKVASDDSVEYEGRVCKLSPFAGTFMP